MALKKVCELYVNAESQTFLWSLFFGDQDINALCMTLHHKICGIYYRYTRDMSKFVSLLNKELL